MTRSISWMLCLLTAGCVGCTAWHGPDTQETPTWDTDPGTATQDTDLCPDGTTVHEGTAMVNNTDDLAALRCVREITGALSVEHTLLTNLDGLDALEKVQDGVRILANVDLVSIEGLRGLTSAGDLSISDALSLPSLAGLEHLTTVRSVGIANNTVLVSIQALASISHLEGGLGVVGNFSLTSLDGLQGLTAIDSGLLIGLNANLGSIDALDGLSSLGGVMSVMSNPFLCQSDVDALAARLGTDCVDCTDNGPDPGGREGPRRPGEDLSVRTASCGGAVPAVLAPRRPGPTEASERLGRWDGGGGVQRVGVRGAPSRAGAAEGSAPDPLPRRLRAGVEAAVVDRARASSSGGRARGVRGPPAAALDRVG